LGRSATDKKYIKFYENNIVTSICSFVSQSFAALKKYPEQKIGFEKYSCKL
jgi:hypothetical protein